MIPPLDPRADAWPHGPRSLVLIGPPGTGKTRSVLQTWLLPALRAGVPPHKILACSFTNDAADEISSRLARELGADVETFHRVCSRTIHSEAYARVRMGNPGVALYDPGERLAPDDVDATEEQPKAGEEPKRLKPTALRTAARTVWDYARNTMAQGRDVEERLQQALPRFAGDRRVAAFTIEQLAADVDEYERSKRERRQIDFTDMLEQALEYQPRDLELLIVDEAQDLSPLQWTLVSRWMEGARVVVLVGDPDQSIFGFAGADSVPLSWYARHQDWTVRRLAASHRVPRAAHRLARDLILQDEQRMDAPYDPAPRPGRAEDVSRTAARAALEEAAREQRPTLVLARSRKVLSEGIARELMATGVPYLSEKGYAPLGAPKAVAMARALCDLRAERGARVRDVKVLLQELPAKTHFPPKKKQNVLIAINEWPEDARVRVETLEVMGLAVRTLLTGSLVEALRAAQVGTDRRSAALGRDRAAELDLLVDRWGPEVLDHEPAVVLTTLHSSKGREAELVVIDMQMPWPSAQAIDSGDDGEERRLLYVGLTRTKDVLLLVRSSAQMDLGHALGLAGVAAAAVA